MKKSNQFMIAQFLIFVFMAVGIVSVFKEVWGMIFITQSWIFLVTVMYAIITREQVDCRCFEEI